MALDYIWKQISKNKEKYLILILILVIIASLFVLEVLARKRILNQELSRKMLHIISVFSAGYSFLIISDNTIVVLIGCLAFLLLYSLIKFKIISSLENRDRRSWGILFLALAYIILGMIWNNDNHWVPFLSLIILAFADSFAGIFGSQFAQRFFNITSDRKSILGSLVFLITSIVVLIISFYAQLGISHFSNTNMISLNGYYLLAIVLISIILTLVEAISSNGSDNLFIPLTASVLIYFLLQQNNYALIINFFIAVLLAFLIGILSYKFKFLTISGSVMTFLLAVMIYGFGAWKWTLPILIFFVFSSLLSAFRKKKNYSVESYFEKSGARDHLQVISNGGFAGLLIIFYQFNPDEVLYLMYLSSIAAVCADTWSTEIGTMRKHKTFNILNFREMEQGISGGISIAGTIGGFSGAVIIALSGLYWYWTEYIFTVLIISIIGLAGSLFDSLLGATLQAQYQCPLCHKIIEKKIHCNEKTIFLRGIKIFDNDLVNFSTSIFGALIFFILRMGY